MVVCSNFSLSLSLSLSDLPTCPDGEKYDWKTSKCPSQKDHGDDKDNDDNNKDNDENNKDEEDKGEENKDKDETSGGISLLHRHCYPYSIITATVSLAAVLVI